MPEAKLSFGIKTSNEFLNGIVLKNYDEFLIDKTSVRKAINCAITAWQLTDWCHKESTYPQNKTGEIKFRESLFKDCPSLKIIQDIAEGSKHMSLYENKEKKSEIKETKEHKGSFSKGFSRAFDISVLKIILKDSSDMIYFEDEIEKVIFFWKGYCNRIFTN